MAGNACRRVFVLSLPVLFFFLSLGASGLRAEMVVQACFSPKGKCSKHILREFDRAQREILVAVYAFTSGELARALVRANRRGVEVRVILDEEFHRDNEHSKGSFLREQGLLVRQVAGIHRGERRGLMHQKFAVIDRTVVLSGSYNWTVAADRFNDENLLLFRDARPLAEEYRKEFFLLWERTR